MPTITVPRDAFLQALGGHWTTEDAETLFFDYGLELDEDTSITEPNELPHKLKIEVPANRYDLLCYEGLVSALRIYLERDPLPVYKLVPPATGAEERWVEISKETAQIRPYFASAILRNVTFTPESYASFIDLQDKLHQNLARKRTLVAIGTHDLDRVAKGRISYEARAPQNIKFAPLNQDTEYRADELMQLYESDRQLGKYLHIIKDSPVYPIIYDSTQQVLSMPPIINSQHTKITLDTKNVFIDMTATDQTKLEIVTNIMVTMFSQYTKEPLTIEQVRNVYPDGRTVVTPTLASTTFTASSAYINSCTGLDLTGEQIAKLLAKMGNEASVASGTGSSEQLTIRVPPTRPDILHECDIMEDVAIAYGFNKLKKTFPRTNTVAQPLTINKLTDILRRECSLSGFTEVLPLTLCSKDENFAWLNRKDNGDSAVVLENPKTAEYQIVRTSLLPGLLKTLRENRKHPLPMKIFESYDVVFKDDSDERRARNVRRCAALYCGRKAGFEVVHGLFDRLMLMLDVENLKTAEGHSRTGKAGYYIKQADDPTFFPDRAAKIFYRPPVDAGVQPAHLMDTGASASNDLETNTDASGPVFTKAPAEVKEDKPSTLETLAEKVKAALPSKEDLKATTAKDVEIGIMGILHPTVLQNFELDYPCSVFEFTVDGL